MADRIRVGTHVDTKFGPAIVHEVRRDAVLVQTAGLLVRVPLSEIKYQAEVPQQQSAEGPPAPESPRTKYDRRSIEALRFGIVPKAGLERLTVGYGRLARWVQDQFPPHDEPVPKCAEVSGAFGTGKSHAMATVRHVAMQEGFVTAHAEVNGTSISLSDPGSLLFHMLSTISGAALESDTPLVGLSLRAVSRGFALAAAELDRFPRVLANVNTVVTLKHRGVLGSFEAEMDALMSSNDQYPASIINRDIRQELKETQGARSDEADIEPRRMVGIGVDERPRDFCECLAGYAVLCRLAGFRGLIVTIDEFEVDHRLPAGRMERVVDLIRELGHWLAGERDTAKVPLGVFFATVGQEGRAGDQFVQYLLSRSSGARLVLQDWDRQQLRILGKNIERAYSDAYEIALPTDDSVSRVVESDLDLVSDEMSGQIRAYIKRYVAELDLRFGPPAA